MSSEDSFEVQVPAAAAGERLDRFLADHLALPRNRVQRWIREERVTLSGAATRPSRVLAGDEVIVYSPPALSDDRVLPQEGPLAVLHEDPDVVVLDKPAGLPMHPGAGRPDGTLANRLVARYPEMIGVGGPGRPGIVHRLDLDTTGIVIAARTDAAYRALSRDFAERRVAKTYLAIAYGTPAPAAGLIELPIGRHPRHRKEMTVRADGRAARSRYSVLAEASGISLLSVQLETGRTHQVRVHLKAIGHPLVGDPTYGEARWKGLRGTARKALERFGRPALHAWSVRFSHPLSGVEIERTSPPPADLQQLWRDAGGAELLDLLELIDQPADGAT